MKLLSVKPESLIWRKAISDPTASIGESTGGSADGMGLRVGVLDSSFNPPTKAHSALLTATAAKLNLDGYLLMISTLNADKGAVRSQSDTTSIVLPKLEGRLAMMSALAEEIQEVFKGQTLGNELAIAVTDKALFIDKAHDLQTLFKGRRLRSFFILGIDTVTRMFNPKYYSDMDKELGKFFDGSSIVYSHRHGNPSFDDFINGLPEGAAKETSKRFAKHLVPITIAPELETVSSTQARDLVAQEAKTAAPKLAALLPNSVLGVIQSKGFYAPPLRP